MNQTSNMNFIISRNLEKNDEIEQNMMKASKLTTIDSHKSI